MTTPDTESQRAAIVSGIAFVLLQLSAFVFFATSIFPNFAPVDAPAAQRAAAIVKLGHTLRLGNYLLMVPAPFFLFFVGGLFVVLRRLRAGNETVAAVALASGAAMALIWPLGAVVSDIELDLAQSGGDVATVSALDAAAPYTLALSAFARAVFVAATSWPLLAVPGSARWAGQAGLLVAGLSLAGTATMVNGSAFPLLAVSSLLFDLWLLVVCVILLRGRG
jgi:hypothetical protein